MVIGLLAAAPAVRAAFEAEAQGPAERAAGTALALGLAPGSPDSPASGASDRARSTAVSVYGFKPFGLGPVDLAAASVTVPLGRAVTSASVSYVRLAAANYDEQVWTARVRLACGRAVAEPGVRVGLVELDGTLEDWAVLVDLAAATYVTGALEVAVGLENPFAMGLAAEHGGVPQRLRAGLGVVASGKLRFGFEVVKEPRFPVSVRSGVDWKVSRGVAVRSGLKTSPAEVAFGIGLTRGWITFDVASSLNFELGSTHEAGITLRWK